MLGSKLKMLLFLFGGASFLTSGSKLDPSVIKQIDAQNLASKSSIISQILTEKS